MAAVGKRMQALLSQVDLTKRYDLREAIALAKKTATAKFNETIELALKLGVDPRQADQMVRGTVALPHGTGKSVKVLAFAKGDKISEAKEAGADHVGGEELVEKIQGGWLDFEAVVATPDMMGAVGKLGRVLGPKGLMPSPKSGTVTFDVGRAVKEIKAGKVEYRVDKNSNVHLPIGKASFTEEQLFENASSVIESIARAKPAASKGIYLRSVAISSTMGPGIRLDQNLLASQYKK